jgi:hypothetical protein
VAYPLLLGEGDEVVNDIGVLHAARKPAPHRHRKPIVIGLDGVPRYDCGHVLDATLVKRGKNNRKRGGAAELDIARTYGGEKVGPLGLPEDIRGKLFATQVKVSQRAAPPMWLREFSKLEGGARTPRLILRFTRQGGLATDRTQDFVVMRGSDFLDLMGRDE